MTLTTSLRTGTLLAALALTAPTLAAEFPAAIALSSLDGKIGFRLDGFVGNHRSGYSAASAGDVNGDGFDDLVIGAYGGSPGGDFFAGQSFVVFGKAGRFGSAINLASLNGLNGFRLDGINVFDESGVSVASAGDVNGDGFADVLISAPLADPDIHGNAGESYVVFGKAGGFASAIDLENIDGVIGFRLDGIDPMDWSGISVGPAGDVNGDGFADVIIGAGYAGPGGYSNTGDSYVVFGKAAGFASSIDLSSLDGLTGFRLDGIDIDDRSGRSVASAGDVNGDGFADLIIGASGGDPGGDLSAGESYVVFGKAAGFASAINLASLDGLTGFRLDGIDAGDGSGRCVASAGDVNGDGFADLIIGANGGDPGGDLSAGESYVVFGKASGFASAINLASLDGLTGFRLDGIDAGDGSGRFVATAGDMNGDGFSDFVIGANFADPNGNSAAGESYVVFGKSASFASFIDLASLDGTTGFRLDGIDAGDESGRLVASTGDMNGDGFGDLVVGAWRADPKGIYSAGESYVIFGRAPDGPVTRVGSAAIQYISGGAFADSLSGLGGDDILEGRAAADTLDGGDGNDTASYEHAPYEVIANLASPGANTGHARGDTYLSIENLSGSRFVDRLSGNRLANTISGGEGDDILRGGGGPDRLIGGPGRDTQTGGGGADIFQLRKTSESRLGDRIRDFNAGGAGTSVDRIDLEAIDANTGVAGDQAFTFIGTAKFSGKAGQLRIGLTGTTTIVRGDVNGDARADFTIELVNFTDLASLTSIDFLR